MNLWTPLYAALCLIPSSKPVVGFQPIRQSSASIYTACNLVGISTQVPTSTISARGAFDAIHPRPLRQQSCRFASSSDDDSSEAVFKQGSKVQVEVVSFGPLGASVDVVGISHDSNAMLPEGAEPYAIGLIYQQEISYFRQARDNVDVVRGEILPGYVQKVRDDGKLDIGLRAFGGKQKSLEVSDQIMDLLKDSPDGTLEVGDKSTPEEINRLFPGVSKTAFKRAIGSLYKKGLITPSKTSISINEAAEQ